MILNPIQSIVDELRQNMILPEGEFLFDISGDELPENRVYRIEKSADGSTDLIRRLF